MATDVRASCVVGGWLTTHEAEHGWTAAEARGHRWAATVFVPSDGVGHAEVAVVAAAESDLLPDGARVFRFPRSDQLPTRSRSRHS